MFNVHLVVIIFHHFKQFFHTMKVSEYKKYSIIKWIDCPNERPHKQAQRIQC